MAQKGWLRFQFLLTVTLRESEHSERDVGGAPRPAAPDSEGAGFQGGSPDRGPMRPPPLLPPSGERREPGDARRGLPRAPLQTAPPYPTR